MSEREQFAKWCRDHMPSYLDPEVYAWASDAWQARADLAANEVAQVRAEATKRERELVEAAINATTCLASQVPVYLEELETALAKLKEQVVSNKKMDGHRTNIEDYAHPWPHHRATCSCGWKGPNRLDRHKARRDESSHQANHALDEIVERAKRTGGGDE